MQMHKDVDNDSTSKVLHRRVTQLFQWNFHQILMLDLIFFSKSRTTSIQRGDEILAKNAK